MQEETPVIKVLEPVSVPVERSKPSRRGMVMVVSTFFGIVVGFGWVLGMVILSSIINKLKG